MAQAGGEQEISTEKRKAQHDKLLSAKPPRTFEHAQFPAYLKHDNIRFDKAGNIAVTFVVQYRFREEVMQLVDAIGMILSLDVAPWQYVRSVQAGDMVDDDEAANA